MSEKKKPRSKNEYRGFLFEMLKQDIKKRLRGSQYKAKISENAQFITNKWAFWANF